ncbi:TIGR04282 family arsenosugar biosynthesis glycosyltransferase [Endozoicomonas arenosclerae]|uniref:TIGR04282 family arsenosugar biosynthesis glycosyltransferase n=1 Tax=Endozoicomonas arenosclerae TaxID=1633495 RepID=UPI0007865B79|nr:DUF2064 domain-containing protein [Endozoicomonas arenosclerae]
MGQGLSLTTDTSLVLVCKKPALHQGKQRLAADLGAEQALAVAELLLACALEDLSEWPGRIVIAPAHENDHNWARQLLKHRKCETLPQGSGNLGERLNYLDHELRSQKHTNIIYIGSDSPTLSFKHFLDTVRNLQIHDTVFSKASDGGVTIMANNKHWPDLSRLPWSTDTLGESLANLCRQSGLTVGYSPSSQDVDHLKDLLSILPELSSDSRPARQALAKHIESVFKQGTLSHA